ncbi:MAG: T9SS type A sorting domain-containing protein [Bacteroidales bacterium]|nr:T9SS type A sorting domain-containing protein [Bacteroidales bacterium]
MNKLTLITLSTIISIAGIIWLSQNENQRSNYQTFLKSKYKEVPAPKKATKEDKCPDEPQLSAYRDFFMMVDPVEKRIPIERYKTARQETQAIRNQKSNNNSSLDWNRIESDMGGRTRSLMWDPNDPDMKKVWAGSVTGGLWYNNDITVQNSEWIAVSDLWENLSISSIAYDPNDSQILYVGTGEAPTAIITYRESSGVGVGIWKTTDGGESWELLASTEEFKYITDLVVRDEEGTSVIYSGVVSGSYRGSDHQSYPTDGLYRSEDGGISWEQVLPNIEGLEIPYAPSDIEITADGRIFVGTGRNLDGEGAARILYSDNGSIGSWTLFDDYVDIIQNDDDHQIPGRVMLATAPSDINRVYALVASGYISSDNNRPYYHVEYIIRSDDKGDTWTEVTNFNTPSNYWASLAWHALTIAVDPNNPDHVFVGGLDQHHSLNGGSSWNKVSDWAGMYYGGGDDYIHADQHMILFKPGSSDEAIFATDGGVFYTQSATQYLPVFMERNNNYSCLQFYTCDIDPSFGSDECIGGLQDNGTLLYSGEDLDINDMVSGGDGAYCFWDYDNAAYFITSVYYNDYNIFFNGSLSNYAGTNSGTFVSPSDYDYKNNTLYANAVGWTGERADQLLRISNIINSPDEDFINLNTETDIPFSTITVSPYSPDYQGTLFVGTEAGQLFKIENAESNPVSTEIGSNNFPSAYLSCVAVGGSEDTLVATFSNYGVSSVWYTTDAGTNWLEIENNLPDMPIRWVIFHPTNKKQVMLATEIGVWTTDNIDSEIVLWTPDNNGLSNVRVDMLQLRENDNTILAATHGRGLHTCVWDDYTTIAPAREEQLVKIYPNPTIDHVNIEFDNSNLDFNSFQILDINGRLLSSQRLNKGLINQQISTQKYANGTYIILLKGNTRTQKQLFVKK